MNLGQSQPVCKQNGEYCSAKEAFSARSLQCNSTDKLVIWGLAGLNNPPAFLSQARAAWADGITDVSRFSKGLYISISLPDSSEANGVRV